MTWEHYVLVSIARLCVMILKLIKFIKHYVTMGYWSFLNKNSAALT